MQATGTNGGVYRVSSDGQVSPVAPGVVANRMVAAGSRMYLAQFSTYQLRMIDDSQPIMTLISTPGATTSLLSQHAMLTVGDGLITPLRPAGTSNHYPYRTTPDGLTLEPLNLNAPRLTEAPLVIAGDDLVYNGRYGTSGRQLARISLSTGDAGWAIDPETVPYSHLPKVFGSFEGAALFEGTMDAQTSTGAHFFWRPGDVQPTTLRTLDIPTRSSAPADFTAHNQSVYFSAIYGSNVRRLMRYDRVTEQVSRVDLQHGVGIDPRNFRVIGDHLFFTGRSGSGWALYRLEDNVPLPLLELPGQFSNNPDHYFEQDGKLRFLHGTTLYESDGTAAGTRQLVLFPVQNISGIVPFGSGYLFAATAPNLGEEPWISDGTAEGTRMLVDLRPGSFSSVPRDLHVVEGMAYFRAGTSSGQPLWVTDGTAAGTIEFSPPEVGSVVRFTVSNDRLYYQTSGSVQRIWSTADTHANAEIVFEIAAPREIGMLVPYHGGAVFRLDGRLEPLQYLPGYIYKTDGTIAGTESIFTGDVGAGVTFDVLDAAGATYVVSYTGVGFHVLITDGTPGRTSSLQNFTPAYSFQNGFRRYLGVDEDGNVYHSGTSPLHGIEPFITPDLVPPQLRPGTSKFDPGMGTFEFIASETVGSFDLSRIELRALGSNAIIPVVASTQGVKLIVKPADPSLASLASDAYRLTLQPGALRDAAGNASQTSATHEVNYRRGDVNFDGLVNNLDISPFVTALLSPQLFELAYGYLPTFLGDVNQDGAVNNLDIAPFVALLTGSRVELVRPVRGAPAPAPVRLSLFADEPVLGLARADAVLPA